MSYLFTYYKRARKIRLPALGRLDRLSYGRSSEIEELDGSGLCNDTQVFRGAWDQTFTSGLPGLAPAAASFSLDSFVNKQLRSEY
jgi:hypothetical protein